MGSLSGAVDEAKSQSTAFPIRGSGDQVVNLRSLEKKEKRKEIDMASKGPSKKCQQRAIKGDLESD